MNWQEKELQEFLSGVVGVVEASRFEELCLWKEFTDEKRGVWKEGRGGLLITVGHLDDRPICVSITTAVINGHKILFLYPTSQLVDHEMIDKWLKKTMPPTVFHEHHPEIVNRTDAMNFYNIFPSRRQDVLGG